MDTNLDVDALVKKTQRLEYEDGLRDFQFAAIFSIIGLANWFFFTPAGLDLFVNTVIRQKDLLLPALAGLLGLGLLLLFGSERVMERIRRATFWRESGFVKPLRLGVVKKSVNIIAATTLLGIIIGSVYLMTRGTISQEAALRSIPASAGMATALVFISLGVNLRIRRYILVGFTGAILSGIILIADISFANAYFWAGLGWGVIFLLSGTWALNGAIRDLRGRATNG